MNELREKLKKTSEDMGASAFGIADLTTLMKTYPDLLKNFKGFYSRAVVVGVRLQDAVLDEIVDKPTVLYLHNYRQANAELDRIGLRLAAMIQDAGHRSAAVPASQILAKEPMRGHISHRILGWAAGIGFIGRSTLLVHPKYGTRMRYASVLTDAELEPDSPHTGDCGECVECMTHCPASAIKQSSREYDLSACLSKLTEFTKIPFVGQYICGVCVKHCKGKTS